MVSLSSSSSRFRIAAISTKSSGQEISPLTIFLKSGNEGEALTGEGSPRLSGLRRKGNIDNDRLTFRDDKSLQLQKCAVNRKKWIVRTEREDRKETDLVGKFGLVKRKTLPLKGNTL